MTKSNRVIISAMGRDHVNVRPNLWILLVVYSGLTQTALGDNIIIVGDEARVVAGQTGIPVEMNSSTGHAVLQRMINGRPMYYATDNQNASFSTRAFHAQQLAPTGFGLTGSGVTLGIWDGGAVLTSHDELKPTDQLRGAFQIDFANFSSFGGSVHATHVAGTMIAAGVLPEAKGMSPGARLNCFDFNNDETEMRTNAVGGLRISNHSYGYISGWRFYCPPFDCNLFGRFRWYGDVYINGDEDAYFGYYSFQSRNWDQISFSNPRYLWCKSAGNDRNEGPGSACATCEFFDWQDPPGFGSWKLFEGNRRPPAPRDGDHYAEYNYPNGYDCIGHAGVAKNGLTVGAVEDVPTYLGPNTVSMSSFSCWGPADDGRIKPDIVGNGVELTSSVYFPPSIPGGQPPTNVYDELTGTSMSSPNVSGSLGLLVQHHRNTHPGADDMLSSTLKAVALHSADECGDNPGPDYRFGWGLMNTLKAAQVISQDAANPHVISETTLSSCYPSIEWSLTTDGTSNELRATICWIDRPPSDDLIPPDPIVLNPSTPALVNDLDLRITRVGGAEFKPWVLSRANPTAAATTGDNKVDNVEQVLVTAPGAGSWKLKVSHKGLQDGSPQTFSMVITGAATITRESKPALLTSRQPDPGTALGSLTSVTVTFDECARNVRPGDLLVNGRGSKNVSGNGAGPYVFSFDNPGNGPVSIQVAPGGILDFADNPFGGDTWTYEIKDCNGNRIRDDIDVQNGNVEDCNGNFVPDPCDPDILKALVGPERSINMDDEIALGESLSAQGGVPPYQYEWTLRGNEGDEISSDVHPMFRPQEPGTYVVRLVVTDARACKSIAYLTIKVAGDGTVPDTSTPQPTPPDTGSPAAGVCGAGGAFAMLTGLASLLGFLRVRRWNRGGDRRG